MNREKRRKSLCHSHGDKVNVIQGELSYPRGGVGGIVLYPFPPPLP